MCPAIPEPPGSNFRGESTRKWRQGLDDVGPPADSSVKCSTLILLSRHAVQEGT